MDRTQIEKISKALADETRLSIYQRIAAKDGIVCGELVTRQGVTPATVSHHMKVLSDAGLIQCRKEGLFVRSRAVPGVIEEYAKALTRIVATTSNSKNKR